MPTPTQTVCVTQVQPNSDFLSLTDTFDLVTYRDKNALKFLRNTRVATVRIELNESKLNINNEQNLFCHHKSSANVKFLQWFSFRLTLSTVGKWARYWTWTESSAKRHQSTSIDPNWPQTKSAISSCLRGKRRRKFRAFDCNNDLLEDCWSKHGWAGAEWGSKTG